jgi:hypothetical protein
MRSLGAGPLPAPSIWHPAISTDRFAAIGSVAGRITIDREGE